MSDSNIYWATEDGLTLAEEAHRKVEERYSHQSLNRGYYERISKLYSYYYGVAQDATAFQITPGGKRGQLSLIYVNFVRYLVQHVLALCNGEKISYSAVPTDNSSAARGSALLAEGVLQSIVREKQLNRLFTQCGEHAMIGNEGFMSVTWDHDGGGEYGVDEAGNVIHEGDIQISVHSVYDITRPENVPGGLNQWILVRTWKNKYDLAAKYPEIADDIVNISTESWTQVYHGFSGSWGKTEDEIIPVYTFYHERTPALPDGRQMTLLSGEIYLGDGPLGYDQIPVFRLAASDILGTVYGYSPANDLLGPIDAMSALLGVSLSNQLTYGVQNLVSKGGSGASLKQLGSSGMQVIETQGDLTRLDPPQTPPEIFSSIEMYKSFMVLLMGQNDTSLGQIASSSRLSASAMSMMEQKAIQFSGPLQASVATLRENVGTAIIRTFQLYSSTKRTMRASGTDKMQRAIEFTGQDFSTVDRMVVEIGNAMMQTPTMRYDLAQFMTQNALLKSPEEVADFIQSGNVKRFTDPGATALINIQKENEMLARGEVPYAVITEDPVLHIRHHKGVLDSPEAKMSPEIIQAVEAHLAQHMEVARNTPPELAAALGHTPIQIPTAAVEGQAPPPMEMPVAA